MNKNELNANKLYVVKPSVVVFDDTEYSFRKTVDNVIMTMPTLKLSKNQRNCINAELYKLRKLVTELEKKSNRTEMEELDLQQAKEEITNLEKIDMSKITIVDHINNLKHKKAITKFKKQQDENVNYATHIVTFENRPQDLSIATDDIGVCKIGICIDVVTDEIYYKTIGTHFCEGEKCINVCENDKILLAKYLWERAVPNIEYNYEIERYILKLKPYYSIDEIITILEQLKSEITVKEENPKTFILKRKTKIPIFGSGVFTDFC